MDLSTSVLILVLGFMVIGLAGAIVRYLLKRNANLEELIEIERSEKIRLHKELDERSQSYIREMVDNIKVFDELTDVITELVEKR